MSFFLFKTDNVQWVCQLQTRKQIEKYHILFDTFRFISKNMCRIKVIQKEEIKNEHCFFFPVSGSFLFYLIYPDKDTMK